MAENLVNFKIIALPTNDNKYGRLCLTENGLDETHYVNGDGDKMYYDIHIINTEQKYLNDPSNTILVERDNQLVSCNKNDFIANDKIIGVLLISSSSYFGFGPNINNDIVDFFLKGGTNITLDCERYSDDSTYLALNEEVYYAPNNKEYEYEFHIDESELNIPIKINNIKEERVSIFYNGNRIGVTNKSLELNDILIQVMEKELEGVTVVSETGLVFKIDKNGRIESGVGDLYPTASNQLEKLLGF